MNKLEQKISLAYDMPGHFIPFRGGEQQYLPHQYQNLPSGDISGVMVTVKDWAIAKWWQGPTRRHGRPFYVPTCTEGNYWLSPEIERIGAYEEATSPPKDEFDFVFGTLPAGSLVYGYNGPGVIPCGL